jgi:hypothetical protein
VSHSQHWHSIFNGSKPQVGTVAATVKRNLVSPIGQKFKIGLRLPFLASNLDGLYGELVQLNLPASDDGHSRINTVPCTFCEMRWGRQKPIIAKLVEPLRHAVVHPLHCIKEQHDCCRYSPDSYYLTGSLFSISTLLTWLLSHSLFFFQECTPRLTLLLYSFLLRRLPSMLKLMMLLRSASKGPLQSESLTFNPLPSSNSVEMQTSLKLRYLHCYSGKCKWILFHFHHRLQSVGTSLTPICYI